MTTRDALADGFDHPRAPEGWDAIVMNPPYVGGKFVRGRLGDGLPERLRARDGFAGDLLSHFLLRALEAVRPGGAVSAIVSDTTLTMESALPVREALLDRAALVSVVWCRPFPRVAVRGGIVTATRRPPPPGAVVDTYDADGRTGVGRARRRPIPLALFGRIPSRPLFRPSAAAERAIAAFDAIEDLPELWAAVGRRGRRAEFAANAADTPDTADAADTADGADTADAGAEPGSWTLLGTAVEAGQGLATGDDRRFVGLLAGTEAGRRALARQHRILDALRHDDARRREWRTVKRQLARGARPDDALLALLDLRDSGEIADLPERKPFRVVEDEDVRRTPLTAAERRDGIAAGPAWVPYETGEQASSEGGARWLRANPVLIDWSAESVALLRHRREHGPRRPVLRHEALWFSAGVTHNRVSSYLRARLLSEQAIFSSESPIYIARAGWLDQWSLLALLNAPVVEFVLKTFLATRNHVELGHVRRLPVPVLAASEQAQLADLGRAAHAAAAAGDANARAGAEREIDVLTRRLYGMRPNQRLTIRR